MGSFQLLLYPDNNSYRVFEKAQPQSTANEKVSDLNRILIAISFRQIKLQTGYDIRIHIDKYNIYKHMYRYSKPSKIQN